MEIIKYLLASTVLISISYLAFLLVYRNGTRFRQQRSFLIAALVLSLILPLTGIKIQSELRPEKKNMTTPKTGANDPGYLINILASDGQGDISRKTDTAIKLYLIITGIIISVFAAQFIRIFRLRRSSVKKQQERFTIIISPQVDSPFSFFRWIFIPKDIEDWEEIESIIIHESVHVTQHHSADNLLTGFTAALMWFNPLVWMMKKSFHLIHEYLADEGTIGSGIDRLRYQAFLINHVAEERLILVSSGFNQSLIKKRMIMMTRDKSKLQKKGRILVLIPLSLILISTTGFINGMFPEEQTKLPVKEYIQSAQLDTPDGVPEFQKDTTRKKTVKVRQAATRNSDSNDNTEIRVVGYGDQKSIDSEIRVIGYGNQKSTDSVIFIVDGTRIKDISTVNPDRIESMTVLKGESAKALYGTEAGNGVILIATKKDRGPEPDKGEPEEYKLEVPENVLYIINGENSDKSKLEQIDPGDIKSIEVFKKENVKQVTDGNYEGVIVVKTK